MFCTLFKDFNVILKVIQMMQSQMEVADTGTTVILQEMNLKLQEREVEIHQLKVKEIDITKMKAFRNHDVIPPSCDIVITHCHCHRCLVLDVLFILQLSLPLASILSEL